VARHHEILLIPAPGRARLATSAGFRRRRRAAIVLATILSVERIGVRELNQHTSRVIERVKRGEVVEVTQRGRLVARLVPAEPSPEPLDRLVAEGRATPPTLAGGIPMPPVLGDPNLDAAARIAATREKDLR
jgi:prevent-host-death family protein